MIHKTEHAGLKRLTPVSWIAISLIIATLNLLVGCNYYKVRTMSDIQRDLNEENINIYQNKNRYFIIHHQGNSWHATNIMVDSTSQIITCILSPVARNHTLHSENPDGFRYKSRKGESVVANEVHIYTKEISTHDSLATISVNDVFKVEVLDKDTGKTIASHVAYTLGILLGTTVLLVALIAALKSSCPFVYTYNGQEYVFTGEIYGGAIFKPLERDDYMPLGTIENSDNFRLRLSNELMERQYTDVANLIVQETNENETPYIDSKGEIHIVKNHQSPLTCKLNSNYDHINSILKKDMVQCSFDATGGSDNFNEMVLEFEKPEAAENAVLILNAKNSYFLDYTFGEFTKLFGDRYNDFVEDQRTRDKDSLINWGINQGLPLEVSVFENGKWTTLEYIPTVGPLAGRDLCIPINLENIPEQIIKVRLKCGFHFWELDYAAMDFNTTTATRTHYLKPESAIDETGADRSLNLSASDKFYLSQPHSGMECEISYKLPSKKENKKYTAFLHTRGYYEHVREYEGIPNLVLLNEFKQPGRFTSFSKSLYDIITNNTRLAVTK